MITNLFFFNKDLTKKELDQNQIYFGSLIFTVCSLLSSVVIGIPALLGLAALGKAGWGVLISLAGIMLLGGLLWALWRDLRRRGKLYLFLEKKAPELIQFLAYFDNRTFRRKYFWRTFWLSIGIEIIGIGLAFILQWYDFALTQAIAITFLFRFFEFWFPLVLGVVAIVGKKDSALLRLWPAVLLFILGVVSLFSGASPGLTNRVHLLVGWLPLEAVHASRLLVLVAGAMMLALPSPKTCKSMPSSLHMSVSGSLASTKRSAITRKNSTPKGA